VRVLVPGVRWAVDASDQQRDGIISLEVALDHDQRVVAHTRSGSEGREAVPKMDKDLPDDHRVIAGAVKPVHVAVEASRR